MSEESVLSRAVIPNQHTDTVLWMFSPQSDGSIYAERYPILGWVVEYDSDCEQTTVAPVTYDSRPILWAVEYRGRIDFQEIRSLPSIELAIEEVKDRVAKDPTRFGLPEGWKPEPGPDSNGRGPIDANDDEMCLACMGLGTVPISG